MPPITPYHAATPSGHHASVNQGWSSLPLSRPPYRKQRACLFVTIIYATFHHCRRHTINIAMSLTHARRRHAYPQRTPRDDEERARHTTSVILRHEHCVRRATPRTNMHHCLFACHCHCIGAYAITICFTIVTLMVCLPCLLQQR